jgi:hypothetical protein
MMFFQFDELPGKRFALFVGAFAKKRCGECFGASAMKAWRAGRQHKIISKINDNSDRLSA